jgi:anthranilate synthase/aminodeoxychorismate synthase-like glutamine amidotransferase
MIIIDNYDSFTYNIVEYFRILGLEPKVFKNDEITLEKIEKINFNYLIISPGAGNPDNSGISMKLIDKYKSSRKILGVCLGHQCICKYFGGKIINAIEPMHGKISSINIKQDEKIFFGVKNPLNVVRYHSLIVDNNLPDCLEVIAQTDKNEIMAIKHKVYDIYGLQFHPEAILTECGLKILENFIRLS